MGLFGNKDGMDCEEEEGTGNLHCRKFKVDKGNKLATGSEATIVVDPNTCKASFTGKYSVLEEDEEDFNRIAKKRDTACKGGLN
ncbi:MAG: hypothetical protein ACFFG0_48465 [Candidatus Thorarchaeota archaeon]